MSKYIGMVRSTVELTGLPSEIWLSPPPLQRLIDSGGLEFSLNERFITDNMDFFGPKYFEWIRVHKNTVSAISHLPAVHVLGQGVLLRTTPGLTAMVSIAEAAFILFGENVSELIRILIQVIEWELRADAANGPIGYSYFNWKKEISFAEHLEQEQKRKREQEREQEWERELEMEIWEREREQERKKRPGADESSEFNRLVVQKLDEIEQQQGALHKKLDGIQEREREWEREPQRERKREWERQKREMEGKKRPGTDESSEFNHLVVQKFDKIEQQQGALHKKLDGIQQQNEEIIRLVKRIYQKSSEADKTLTPGPEMASELIPSRVEGPSKYYRSYSASIGVRKKDGQWFICAPKTEEDEVRLLLDWLEVALGGSGVDASSRIPIYYIQLEEENKARTARDRLRQDIPKETYSCWRNKILSGNILVPDLKVAIPPGKSGDGLPLGNRGFSHPFSQMEDSLILTAAALWSLFDNSLERVPNCHCTFRTESKDFIQCKSKSGKWLLWHTFRNEKLCEGNNCDDNIRVALTAEETGERLYTTSPCVLGWAVENRTEPTSLLWETLRVTKDFRNKEYVRYPVKEFQALAQLSVPCIITPQISTGFTFSKENYQVANSIDHESVLAMETAAAAVVLIFDERRRLHLLHRGADIIEILCVQYIRDMDLSIPVFTHSNPLLRLQTWYHSNFVSSTGKQLTGDHLIREASKKISRLAEVVMEHAREKKLLYWLLEDVLQGRTANALKTPKSQQASWHMLAFESPPLIFAVGELNARRLTMDGSPLKWQPSNANANSRLFNLARISRSHSTPWGIVGGLGEVKRWLFRAQFFYKATLQTSDDSVTFGSGPSDSEHTYEVVECSPEKASSDINSASCENCKQDGTRVCLHYIQ